MSNQTLEINRVKAEKLADLIMSGSDDKEQMAKLKQELGLLDYKSTFEDEPGEFFEEVDDDPEDDERIGIWKLQVINGQEFYVRDPKKKNEYSLWAKVHRILPKGNNNRICFLGESVARGFLYSPQYTPAVILEKILNMNQDDPGSEVIDLSKTDCSMRELTKLVNSCFAFSPDAVVIFAGNNWHIDIDLSDEDYRLIIQAIKNKSWYRDLRRIMEDKYVEMISNFISYISDLSGAHHVPFIVIIPEFNLLDWHSNEREKRLLFPHEDSGQWFQLKTRVEQAMAQGQPEKVESLCREMIALDKTNPFCYEQLAQCKLRDNLLKEALEYLRLAHDTRLFQFMHNPGILSITRDTLLELTERFHIPVVNLQEIFNRHEQGVVPGRQLFLDYCHLSADGIKLAMTHTARCIAAQLKGNDILPDETKMGEMNPDDWEAGITHFFAAVHNAHWGQSGDIVYYHCKKALESSGLMGDLMKDYSIMASRHIPWIITREFEKLADAMFLSSYSLSQPEGQEIMDIVLVDEMIRALSTVNIDIKDKIHRLRKEEHGFSSGRINLLESYYHQTFAREVSPQTRHYYRAFDFQSRFFLITGSTPHMSLHLTCRLPANSSTQQWLEFFINDEPVSKLPVGDEWGNHIIRIPQQVLIDGINTITLQWPVLNCWHQMEKKEDEPYHHFLTRRAAPIFGEIHMFRAFIEEDV